MGNPRRRLQAAAHARRRHALVRSVERSARAERPDEQRAGDREKTSGEIRRLERPAEGTALARPAGRGERSGDGAGEKLKSAFRNRRRSMTRACAKGIHMKYTAILIPVLFLL